MTVIFKESRERVTDLELLTFEPDIVSIDGIPLAASSHGKLQGVTIDTDIRFENHHRVTSQS